MSDQDRAALAQQVVPEALKAAMAAIYFADSADYLPALWGVVRALSPEIAELAERDARAAWEKADALAAAPAAPQAEQQAEREPIDMVLHCPKCGMQHIDAPEDADCDGEVVHSFGWSNPPHRSHLCHGCGHVWRPADVPTNGVQAVKTKGKADSPVMQQAEREPVLIGGENAEVIRQKLRTLDTAMGGDGESALSEVIDAAIRYLSLNSTTQQVECEPYGWLFGNSFWEATNRRITDEIKRLGKPLYDAPQTEPMSRERAIAIARKAAVAARDESGNPAHSYLPMDSGERWTPHEWVVEAIMAAAGGRHAECEPLTDEQVSELSHEMVKGGKSVNWLARTIERQLADRWSVKLGGIGKEGA